jgi:hypothetical protein
VSHLISVQLDALAVLLQELTALGRQLTEEALLSASTGRSLGEALSGAAGSVAGGAAADVGADWTAVVTALAARTLAVAATLDSALAAYRAADAGIAERIGTGRRGSVAVAR